MIFPHSRQLQQVAKTHSVRRHGLILCMDLQYTHVLLCLHAYVDLMYVHTYAVGEPLSSQVLAWFRKNIGHDGCKFVDTWWQTGIIVCSLLAV